MIKTSFALGCYASLHSSAMRIDRATFIHSIYQSKLRWYIGRTTNASIYSQVALRDRIASLLILGTSGPSSADAPNQQVSPPKSTKAAHPGRGRLAGWFARPCGCCPGQGLYLAKQFALRLLLPAAGVARGHCQLPASMPLKALKHHCLVCHSICLHRNKPFLLGALKRDILATTGR